MNQSIARPLPPKGILDAKFERPDVLSLEELDLSVEVTRRKTKLSRMTWGDFPRWAAAYCDGIPKRCTLT